MSISFAEKFDVTKNVHVCPLKTGKFRTVKLQCSPNNSTSVKVQFTNGPGDIPQSFGVKTNDYGKTVLTFSVPCEKELKNMQKAKKDFVALAKKNKVEWWPKGISDTAIEENFSFFLRDPAPKERGDGFWPAKANVTIPISNETGDMRCKVVDMENQPVALEDIAGRQWHRIIVELSGIYFSGKNNWGIGPRKLVCLQVSDTGVGGQEDYSKVEFLTAPVTKKRKLVTA